MMAHIFQQISRYQSVVEKFECKYGMAYLQFEDYLQAQAKQLATEPAGHKQFMLEEEDALDWKIAVEMLANCLESKTQNKNDS